VDSALRQDHPGTEVIVIDDCSTDDSPKILAQHGERIKFKSLETNQGPGAARNRGAEMATGNFLVFLDGDDLLLPWSLEVYSRIIEARAPKLILGRMWWFQGALGSADSGCIEKEIAIIDYDSFMKKDRAWRASASALVMDHKSFDEVGGWTPRLFPMDDHDLVLKMGYAGRTIQIVSPSTTAYRVHGTNVTHQIQRLVDGTLSLIQREKNSQYPGGRSCRAERYAIIGGTAFTWLKKSLEMRMYDKGFAILSAGWPMIAAAIFRRLRTVFVGKKPVEKLGEISTVSARNYELLLAKSAS
jgi:hypothetical protein